MSFKNNEIIHCYTIKIDHCTTLQLNMNSYSCQVEVYDVCVPYMREASEVIRPLACCQRILGRKALDLSVCLSMCVSVCANVYVHGCMGVFCLCMCVQCRCHLSVCVHTYEYTTKHGFCY